MRPGPSGTAPHWRGYIGAADVDAIAGQAVGLGARIQQPVQDVPGVGRVALLTDPEGRDLRRVSVRCTDSDSAPSQCQLLRGTSWRCAIARPRWRSISGCLAGNCAHPWIWAVGSITRPSASAIRTLAAPTRFRRIGPMPPAWCPYAASSSADETAGKVLAAGGQLAHGPVEVPGGGRIVQFFDAAARILRGALDAGRRDRRGRQGQAQGRCPSPPGRRRSRRRRKPPRRSPKKARSKRRRKQRRSRSEATGCESQGAGVCEASPGQAQGRPAARSRGPRRSRQQARGKASPQERSASWRARSGGPSARPRARNSYSRRNDMSTA